MKKIIITILILLLRTTLDYGQTNIYHEFPDTNAFWGDFGGNIFNSSICHNTRYGINGDTVIGTKNYKKVYSMTYDTAFTNPYFYSYYASIREEDKRVYTIIDTFPEEVLYDFNLLVGDSITYHYSVFFNAPASFTRIVTQIDSVLLANGQYRKRWALEPTPTSYAFPDTVVEGIGSVFWWGLFNPLVNTAVTNGDHYYVTCIKDNDTVLYLNNPSCNHCFCSLYTDILKKEEPEKIQFSPNPFSTQTILRLDKQIENASFIIYNSFGQKVKFVNSISGEIITLNRDHLPAGFYFFQLTENGKASAMIKLVIAEE